MNIHITFRPSAFRLKFDDYIFWYGAVPDPIHLNDNMTFGLLPNNEFFEL